MDERLSQTLERTEDVIPHPMGIGSSDLSLRENGIDPSQPPEVIEAEKKALATAAIKLCEATEVTEVLGQGSYSELLVEKALALISSETTETQDSKEQILLDQAQTSTDPVRSSAAEETLAQNQEGIDPEVVPEYYENLRAIKALKQLGSLTPTQKSNLARLEQAQRVIKRGRSDSSRLPRMQWLRERSRRKGHLKGRKGFDITGSGEEQAEAVLDGKGTHGRWRHGSEEDRTESKERKKRREAEESQTRNRVSRKGAVVEMDSRRYVVEDVISTDAQAFVIESYTDGKAIIKRKRDGTPALDSIYLAELDPKGNPIIDPHTGLAKLQPMPVPRDDRYRSGRSKNSSNSDWGGPYFYEDGRRVPDMAVGPESFSPIDDEVVLKPLLTGEEAILVLMEGDSAGISLAKRIVRLKEIVSNIEEEEARLLSEKERVKSLRKGLVFEKSDASTPAEITLPGEDEPEQLRPPYDQKMDTGHFRRFRYDTMDPYTARQTRAIEHLEVLARARIEATKKKGQEARGNRFA